MRSRKLRTADELRDENIRLQDQIGDLHSKVMDLITQAAMTLLADGREGFPLYLDNPDILDEVAMDPSELEQDIETLEASLALMHQAREMQEQLWEVANQFSDLEESTYDLNLRTDQTPEAVDYLNTTEGPRGW